jgi:hypothetical protein
LAAGAYGPREAAAGAIGAIPTGAYGEGVPIGAAFVAWLIRGAAAWNCGATDTGRAPAPAR